MIPIEQSIVNWIIMGALLGIMYGLRYLVILDKRLYSLESSMHTLLKKIEREEKMILLEEKLLSRAILKKRKK